VSKSLKVMMVIPLKSIFKETACLQTHRQNVATLPTLPVVSLTVSLFQTITCRTQVFFVVRPEMVTAHCKPDMTNASLQSSAAVSARNLEYFFRICSA
jgi:hypothetical protein